MNRKWVGPAILLIISITVIHIVVPAANLPLHNYLRELYLIPIILAGIWWGVRGGLTVSIISSLLYLPHFLFAASPPFHTRNIVEILLYNLVGYLVGKYRETSKRDHSNIEKKAFLTPSTGKHFLFCVANTPSSTLTAKWFSEIFVNDPEVSVTLFWVVRPGRGDYFQPLPEETGSIQGKKVRGNQNLLHVKQFLLEGGAMENKIQIKIVECFSDQTVADKILEELNSGQYDTVLVSKHEATKAQEIVFGDTTLDLVRKSPVPILIAKGLTV